MTDVTRPTGSHTSTFDDVWREQRAYLVALAARMLANHAEAEDVVQDAFDRLARIDLTEIEDVRGWLTVVVRRLALDRIRSAYARRESAVGDELRDTVFTARVADADPADRVTLDDQVQVALAVVLDQLTPAERTAFVLHDVFGFPYGAVGEIVGRTTAACRQLASRARRSIRQAPETPAKAIRPDEMDEQHRVVSERFIAACQGGDIVALMEVLDPGVEGDAILYGFGPMATRVGRPAIAERLLGLLGPSTDSVLVPTTIEREPGLVVWAHRRLAAVVRFHAEDGLITHIHALVLPPRR
jgi:RNA polymerase sigma-70 factor, ECF subfamily